MLEETTTHRSSDEGRQTTYSRETFLAVTYTNVYLIRMGVGGQVAFLDGHNSLEKHGREARVLEGAAEICK